MNAPRKIWINTDAPWDGMVNPKYGTNSYPLYHHDDVVRELVEAARDVDQWMRGNRGYERVGYGAKLRAALAKFAQEEKL